jgi:hypothetical protein
MKTLRLLRNVAALFMFVTPLLISQPSNGTTLTAHKPRCVKTSNRTNCLIVSGTCYTQPCYFGCSYTACASK